MAARIAARLATRPAADRAAEFRAAGVPAAPVQDVAQALGMPHLVGRDLFLTVPGPDGAPQTILNAGFRFASGGPGTDRPAPTLGAGPPAA